MFHSNVVTKTDVLEMQETVEHWSENGEWKIEIWARSWEAKRQRQSESRSTTTEAARVHFDTLSAHPIASRPS